MEPRRTVSVDLPVSLLVALGRAAETVGTTPSAHLATILCGALSQTPPRRPRQEEIARALDLSGDWVTLQSRLRAIGYVLRPDTAGDLMLMRWPLEHALIPAAQIGLGRTELTLRFGAAFPTDIARKSRVEAPRRGFSASSGQAA